MLKTSADVVRWATILIEHHMLHAGEDETAPNWIKVDPVDLIQVVIALQTEGYGLPTTFENSSE
jgi:hypothetical protein